MALGDSRSNGSLTDLGWHAINDTRDHAPESCSLWPMAGFPAIPTRDHFGPTLVDRYPVRDTSRELGADAMNLAFHQIAGASRVLPQAVLVFDPTLEEVTYQALAFDPSNALDPVDSAKNATGDYTLTFEASYRDEKDVLVPFAPKAAAAFVLGDPQLQPGPTIAGQAVGVKVRDFTNGLQDAKVLVLVWG